MRELNRQELEKNLGKKVEIKLFDGDIFEGMLSKTGEEKFKRNNNLYIPRNYYFLTDNKFNCISCLFRVSHITKLKRIEE